MKIFKSIKWRLQLWYGLILVAVLVGFGVTAYQLERNRQFRKIDDDLHHRIGVLGAALHHGPPRGGPDGMLFDRFHGPPPDQMPGDGPPGEEFHKPDRFQLPVEDQHFFEPTDPHQFYFGISDRYGHEIARSTNQPHRELKWLTTMISENSVSQPGRNSPQAQTFGDDREAEDVLPSGETIWVGCSIAPELSELRRTSLNLLAIGGLILLVGLMGGWWMVSRALRPIEEISGTAAKISAGDLSQRINATDAESELGQLAAVLNSTFARLETAFAQQKQFASDAAHELRTPVSVILTQTQTALNRERDAGSYKLTVEACQRAAQRMRKLIESLLALARFDAGQEVLKRLKFDLAKTARECADMVQPLAEERGVKIIFTGESLEITGDPERLAQVITNLLTNAIQYNQPQGEVRLGLKSEGGLAVLTVMDTGQGIAPENLAQVFGRFYRADTSRTGAGNSGLGLAISKAIVEAHAGTIEVSSQENVGTMFTIRLPIG